MLTKLTTGAVTPGPWLVQLRTHNGHRAGLWIHGASQAGGNVIDTDSIDVYPLKLEDKRAIEAAPLTLAALADIRSLLPEEYFIERTYEVSFTGKQLLELDNILRLGRGIECDGCDGSGIRPNASNSLGIEPPSGFVIVERCDTCDQFAGDLEAAEAWGTAAHHQTNRRGTEWQAIAMPKGEANA